MVYDTTKQRGTTSQTALLRNQYKTLHSVFTGMTTNTGMNKPQKKLLSISCKRCIPLVFPQPGSVSVLTRLSQQKERDHSTTEYTFILHLLFKIFHVEAHIFF